MSIYNRLIEKNGKAHNNLLELHQDVANALLHVAWRHDIITVKELITIIRRCENKLNYTNFTYRECISRHQPALVIHVIMRAALAVLRTGYVEELKIQQRNLSEDDQAWTPTNTWTQMIQAGIDTLDLELYEISGPAKFHDTTEEQWRKVHKLKRVPTATEYIEKWGTWKHQESEDRKKQEET